MNERSTFTMNVTFDMDENQTQLAREDSFYYGHNIGIVLLAVMISSLSFVGILGNIPVLIVFCRRKERKASNTFIKVLAFLDLLVCAFVMPYSIVYEYHLVTSDIVCRIFEFLIHFCIAASNITLGAIATERYIAVCQISKRINVRIINRGVYGILLMGVLIAAPSVGTFAVVKDADVKDVPCSFPHENTNGYFCHFTYTIMGHDIVRAYQVFQMCLFFILLVAIIVLYSIVYGVLWKKTQIRKSLTRRRESCAVSLSERQIVPIIESDSLIKNNDHNQVNHTKDVYCQIGPTVCNASNTYTSTYLNNHIETPPKNNGIECSTNELHRNTLPHRTDSKVTFQNSLEKIEISDNQIQDTEDEQICKIESENRSRQNSSVPAIEKVKPRRSYHRRTAKMLFLCTVIYFVTWLPFWFDIFGVTNSRLLRYVFFIAHATNPIVYGIVNRQVRRAFKRLLFDCLKTWCYDSSNLEGPSNTENASFSGTSI
ncbi:alpha-2C adrenergic receptor-like [Mercenaria mercenaria]|uniref:alpha-2C adrenergic receptor-like n=1 Tax=Mercenaria mercenaria TaxID=6596 RepID=UPI00234E60C9|nr:alpha-2C adrenergic receptor-like [Mercenaria mercenaria]XP_053384739.1 alpha-2C adrenergic receptor-like [Mercenaria mercenaria]XP_053384740.1 alpha-2C adrenergic receptor-like [Mercenaria mercenaria]XP_053384741.1 alpha-2C adrenergic receptor-like [Mercenaria mercenaria]XP_053384742.1 alpha-2C adrenergic receptor-like [Mercenaria mercenaria]XP_053384743.1 alpha-2C adrenergic receptor-like [Mercenaria mercenaria]XP_053384744.1 alpha-2C adrenergic receptor-like [Mercenaria mercenaria]XP_0